MSEDPPVSTMAADRWDCITNLYDAASAHPIAEHRASTSHQATTPCRARRLRRIRSRESAVPKFLSRAERCRVALTDTFLQAERRPKFGDQRFG